MTNIELQTIGALARLKHQLEVDVAKHLRAMKPNPSADQEGAGWIRLGDLEPTPSQSLWGGGWMFANGQDAYLSQPNSLGRM